MGGEGATPSVEEGWRSSSITDGSERARHSCGQVAPLVSRSTYLPIDDVLPRRPEGRWWQQTWTSAPHGARMFSGLRYAKYRQQLEAKCFRVGGDNHQDQSAHTSTIGTVEYAARCGWSVHAAAAGVIARRGQMLSERLRARARKSVFGAKAA